MKIAIMAIGEDRQTVTAFSRRLYAVLPDRSKAADNTPLNLNIVVTDITTVNAALKLGIAPLPTEFNSADYRLMVAADSEANDYLRTLQNALEQAYVAQHQVTANQLPYVITMSDAVAWSCSKTGLRRLAILQAGPIADSNMTIRLQQAAALEVVELPDKVSQQLRVALSKAAVDTYANADDNRSSQSFRQMVNVFCGKLVDMVVIDGDAASLVLPVLRAYDELPVLVDAEAAYLETIKELVVKTASTNTPPLLLF